MSQTMLMVDGCNPSDWFVEGVSDQMIEGGVAAANATSAIWEGFVATMDATARWHRRFRTDPTVLQVLTADDVRRAHEERRAGIILGWQNIEPIENDLDRLDLFAALGVRIVQLAYNVRNLVANGCFERHDDGLSHFGVQAVGRLNELGVLIDLSHVGDRSSRETIELSTRPVAFTHTNLREFHDSPRNKPAELVRVLAQRGGVVGANAFPQFLPSGWDAALPEYLDGVERLIEVAGVDHVGIASDFCEGRDAEFWRYLGRLHGTLPTFDIQVPADNPTIKGYAGTYEMANVGEGLRDRGYAEADVAKVMGGNWVRLYAEVWGS